jgi:hypothetical protein
MKKKKHIRKRQEELAILKKYAAPGREPFLHFDREQREFHLRVKRGKST